ncbi:MAG: glycoside hydrolase [Gammaproteobacteria bacterium]|nr:glycoside hydrolase [Gammaproteobacteria bacterium]
MLTELEHSNKLNVVLYWHMHQPEYRDLKTNQYQLPWTYLHTIKDYVDMVAHIENNPEARAVVNFAPILLEQIDDYAKQLEDFLSHGIALRDPLLSCLAMPVVDLPHKKRIKLINTCKRANKERLIDRFKFFNELHEMAEDGLAQPYLLDYYSPQFYADLLTWYHLAWIGETVRNSDKRIKRLSEKARNFNEDDRRLLLQVIYELVAGVIKRYKKLAKSGRIELSMTPLTHPIIPLILDLNSASDAMPDVELPEAENYPGGIQRSLWQLKNGAKVFEKHFGFKPQGCWPSEGSISGETIDLINSIGIKWLASGETVLRNSMKASELAHDHCIYHDYYYQDKDIACFYRDDGLSDLIGFKYSNWHADDAVANFVSSIEHIAEQCKDEENAIVSIILDGENAWEYYPFNGFYFLEGLYKELSNNEHIQLTTYSEFLDKKSKNKTTEAKNAYQLSTITSGSWVYGTFSTWIGEKDKNKAWDMLVEAKKAYDQVIDKGELTDTEYKLATEQLATCESSDWFWWFGEYNSSESVRSFDQQYRLHLSNLYELLGLKPPEYLSQAFSFGSGEPVMGGVMLPGKES